MSPAFGGDAAVRHDLLVRLERHAAAGTLRFGATAWDGVGGSPLGVSVESTDAGVYATRFGYPLSLAGLLDPLTARSAPDRAVEDTMRWVGCVEPGAELSRVPAHIADDLLVRLAADRHAAAHYRELRALHLAEASGTDVPRRDWADRRRQIEETAGQAGSGSEAAALAALGAACWSLLTSRSVLTALIDLWLHDVGSHFDPEFDAHANARTMALLETIYAQTQSQRDRAEFVDIPAILREREPDLSRRFEAHLARTNERFDARGRALPGLVLDHLAAVAARAE